MSARNLAGVSDVSDISIISADYPTMPLNVKQSLEVVSKDNITITWDSPVSDGGANITEYEINFWEEQAPSSGLPTGLPRAGFSGISTANNYTQTNLTEGAIFFVTVHARNIIGPGVGNVEITALVGAAPEGDGTSTVVVVLGAAGAVTVVGGIVVLVAKSAGGAAAASGGAATSAASAGPQTAWSTNQNLSWGGKSQLNTLAKTKINPDFLMVAP